MPFGKLPLSFDHVIASDGLTMQKMLKEGPWLTEILEGVTSIRGGTGEKEKEKRHGSGCLSFKCRHSSVHYLRVLWWKKSRILPRWEDTIKGVRGLAWQLNTNHYILSPWSFSCCVKVNVHSRNLFHNLLPFPKQASKAWNLSQRLIKFGEEKKTQISVWNIQPHGYLFNCRFS